MPAIHFEASRTKGKAWRKWIAAIPRAKQLKLAVETDRRNVLGEQNMTLPIFSSKTGLTFISPL